MLRRATRVLVYAQLFVERNEGAVRRGFDRLDAVLELVSRNVLLRVGEVLGVELWTRSDRGRCVYAYTGAYPRRGSAILSAASSPEEGICSSNRSRLDRVSIM